MATRRTNISKTGAGKRASGDARVASASPEPPLPDAPKKRDMEQFNHYQRAGVASTVYRHFVDLGRDDALVSGEGCICFSRRQPPSEWRWPDMVVALGVDPPAIEANNGYEIDNVGKPPDFVMEAASRGAGGRDYTTKREDYAAFGIAEYWRFDYTGGRYHDAPLAGDRLVNDRYEPIPLTDDRPGKMLGMRSGYSSALDLYLCWDNGRLHFYDPKADGFLLGPEELQSALAEAQVERDAALQRIRQLEAELGW